MKKSLSIVIGTDHRGFPMKEYIKKHLAMAVTWIDVGAFNDARSDYPEFAFAAVHEILKENATHGILLCGTGVGMVIAANRFPTIFAALAWNEEIARLCKEDDNANILSLPADYCTHEEAVRMVRTWLTAEFKHNRYEERIEMINRLHIKNE